MLFIYAKLNPGLRYIQGMNELLAPIYYLFKTDSDRASTRYAEADAFFCFVSLLSEFQDHFCQQLDNSSSGIKAAIRRLMELLAALDYELWSHLEAKNKVRGAGRDGGREGGMQRVPSAGPIWRSCDAVLGAGSAC
jgi:hypothetical protein